MSITVTRAELGDADEIFAAEHEYIDCPWTREQITAAILAENCVFLSARDQSGFCGYVSGDIVLDECEINNIAVVLGSRRCGVADRLLDTLIGELVARKVKSVFLLVREGNEPAISLYLKHGFVSVGRRKNYYKGCDAIIMRLSL